jgi:hypothetical protein
MLNPRQIHLPTGESVNRHRDQWAERSLVDPTQWEAALISTRSWLEYSAGNQLMLASYGADGAVAGLHTWRHVPSTDGRTCAVRRGEHGLPVRVPIVEPSAEPDPHVGGTRPRLAAKGWEWQLVWCEAQLARHPAAGALLAPEVPESLTASGSERWPGMARRVAAKTVRGRVPQTSDPVEVLANAAGRLRRSGNRPSLNDTLSAQVAWLVADRVGHAPGALPEFDPGAVPPRERWQLLLDVLDPSRKLTAELSRAVGVDLLAPVVPKMQVEDDGVVPAGRRNRLPKSSLDRLPLQNWVEVGPYSSEEWASRGETAAGRGAYLRLNTSAYVVVIEQGETAQWRLEDVKNPQGAGLLASGDTESLDDGKAAATATLRARYPQLAVEPKVIAAAESAGPLVESPGWQSWGDPSAAQGAARRHFGEGIWAYVFPGPDGAWLPMVHRPGELGMESLPASGTRVEAISTAQLSALRAVREMRLGARQGFDDAVAELAASPGYQRSDLAVLVGAHLDPEARETLEGDLSPSALAELVGTAGVTSQTTVRLLRAEGVSAEDVADLLPVLGIPPAEALRALHEGWQVSLSHAAELAGASAADMRTAGCSATEIMLVRPREVMRHLSADPALWDLAAGTMATAGHPAHEVVAHLASHAPSPECFAAGVAAAVDDPAVGIALAVRQGLPAEALVATSERYGVAPIELASALADAGASAPVMVPSVLARCDGDAELATQILRSATPLRTDQIVDALVNEVGLDATAAGLRELPPLSRDRNALIAAHVPPRQERGVVHGDFEALLSALPAMEDSPVASIVESAALAEEPLTAKTVPVGRDE